MQTAAGGRGMTTVAGGRRSVVRGTGRRAVRAFGVATSPLRTLPDFLIIGTKRGGTTSLHRWLMAHHQVLPLFPSAARLPLREEQKGVHYLDARFGAGEAWYRSHFPTAAHKHRLAARRGAPVVAGEATPYYLYHPRAAARARELLPDVRLIVLLRDPVDRAHSHWKEQRRRGQEPLDRFEAALDAEPVRLAGQLERMEADPAYVSFAHEHQSYVLQGRYDDALDAWWRRFPPEQFLLLRSEDLFTDPQATYGEVLAFLGLQPMTLPDPRRLNASDARPVPERQRRRLEEAFAPSTVALEARLGRSFGWGAG